MHNPWKQRIYKHILKVTDICISIPKHRYMHIFWLPEWCAYIRSRLYYRSEHYYSLFDLILMNSSLFVLISLLSFWHNCLVIYVIQCSTSMFIKMIRLYLICNVRHSLNYFASIAKFVVNILTSMPTVHNKTLQSE